MSTILSSCPECREPLLLATQELELTRFYSAANAITGGRLEYRCPMCDEDVSVRTTPVEDAVLIAVGVAVVLEMDPRLRHPAGRMRATGTSLRPLQASDVAALRAELDAPDWFDRLEAAGPH